MVFHDGRRGEPGDRQGVVAWSQTLVGALRNEVDAHADTARGRDRSKRDRATALRRQDRQGVRDDGRAVGLSTDDTAVTLTACCEA
jgi:hypothetical protein